MRNVLLSSALAGLVAATATVAHASPSYPVLTVPEHGGYAQINLPDYFSKIVFPPGTELDGKAVSLNHGKTILLKFMPNSIKGTLIGFISLQNGQVIRVGFRQRKGAPPPVWYAPGRDISIHHWHTPPTLHWIVGAMRSTVMYGKPKGMVPVHLPPAATIGAIKASPLAAWSSGGYTLLEYRLSSKTLTAIEPRDFYRSGVVAVLTQADVVSPVHSPAILILERSQHE
ncbi:hypothetical protein BJI67_16230 (plasmid) [Acidihalobacter aeolianus]|uniref:Uncharacterized protein n=1 Tax=Acidihalobacter aeolianus TaxID=2792603 RepID=A0A1D8KCU6_9GAMM|nr:hypothetical protein [Acidihalobacter aeolianus]AOV18786.1 hypothetical protein BJI67_16230 [Acidihalobacter aeolianus]